MSREELAFARAMIDIGVPVFWARAHDSWCGQCESMKEPCHFSKVGFWLPRGWQFTEPDHKIIERWKPGDALCAVMGHVYDLVDYDLRNDPDGTTQGRLLGDDAGPALLPKTYVEALTPSGGRHYFIKSLNVRSMDNLMSGLDVKAGTKEPDDFDSHGRGYAFIYPTIKISKMTGKPETYRVLGMPNAPLDDDDSGEELRRAMKHQWNLDHPEKKSGGIISEWARELIIGRAIRTMARAPHGERDNTLRDKLWLLANNGATQSDYDRLAEAARSTGLDPRIIEQKIQRALRRTGGIS